MSNSDSFIDEVTEEVRRDRLFALMRRYGWIAILVVVLIVAGAAWREYSAARDQARAQDFGDAIMAALDEPEGEARIAALEGIEAANPTGQAIVDMLIAADLAQVEDGAAAVQRLQAVANNEDVPAIYRQIASFKAYSRSDSGLSAEERRDGLQALAIPGQPLNLLAEEQLALLDIEAGDTPAALERLKGIAGSSEATSGLRRRAQQLIVALGGELENA